MVTDQHNKNGLRRYYDSYRPSTDSNFSGPNSGKNWHCVKHSTMNDNTTALRVVSYFSLHPANAKITVSPVTSILSKTRYSLTAI